MGGRYLLLRGRQGCGRLRGDAAGGGDHSPGEARFSRQLSIVSASVYIVLRTIDRPAVCLVNLERYRDLAKNPPFFIGCRRFPIFLDSRIGVPL